jgi:hypothetical protein
MHTYRTYRSQKERVDCPSSTVLRIRRLFLGQHQRALQSKEEEDQKDVVEAMAVAEYLQHAFGKVWQYREYSRIFLGGDDSQEF